MLDHYDFDYGGTTISDCAWWIAGDVVANVRNIDANARNAVAAIRQISERGAVPIVLGGDDSAWHWRSRRWRTARR